MWQGGLTKVLRKRGISVKEVRTRARDRRDWRMIVMSSTRPWSAFPLLAVSFRNGMSEGRKRTRPITRQQWNMSRPTADTDIWAHLWHGVCEQGSCRTLLSSQTNICINVRAMKGMWRASCHRSPANLCMCVCLFYLIVFLSIHR